MKLNVNNVWNGRAGWRIMELQSIFIVVGMKLRVPRPLEIKGVRIGGGGGRGREWQQIRVTFKKRVVFLVN
jgi:hypothetical protein